MICNQDILFLSGIRWDFSWQRHQEFASLFARNNRVLFVEMALSPAILLRERRTTLVHWRNWRLGVREVRKNVYAYSSPPVFPFGRSFLLLNRLNRRLIFAGVKKAMDKLKVRSPLVWLADPYLSFAGRDFGQRLTVFDWIHGSSEAKRTRKARVYQSLTREAVRCADVIFTPSRSISKRYGAEDRRFFFVSNGVAAKLFAKASVPRSMPPDLASIPPPIIGFSGTVGPAVDMELLKFLARERKDWSFVFMGLVRRDVSALQRFANVHFLGFRERQELPRYLSSFSAGIIPYIVSSETETVHPVKTYEYLAAGLPVVSTRLPELIHLGGMIELAGDVGNFLHSLEQAVSRDTPYRREERKAFALSNTWEKRMLIVQEAIERAMNKKKKKET